MGRPYLPRQDRYIGSDDWKQHGQCASMSFKDLYRAEIGEIIFFSDDGRTLAHRFAQLEAREICEQCPVREPCETYATINRLDGIWGGYGSRERRRRSKLRLVGGELQPIPYGGNDGREEVREVRQL